MKAISQKTLLLWIVVLVVCAFFLLNACALLISQKYQTATDLTQEGMYNLSQTTIDVCHALKNETHVYVFASEDDYPSMLAEMLRRYDQLSERVIVEYYDPTAYPMMVSHYQQLGYSVGAMDLLVEGEKRIKHIPYDQLLLYEGETLTGIQLEQQLTAGVLYVNANNVASAVLTTGHNERSTTALKKLLENNSFVVREQSLALGQNLDASLVILAGPAYDFTQQETQVLENYLADGGKVMAFIEPTEQAFPNLNDLFQKYGIVPEKNVVFETQAYMAGMPSNIIPMYTNHELNRYFATNPIYVVMPATCSLSLPKTNGVALAEAILTTTPDAYAKADIRYQTTQKSAEDASGTFVVAALGQKTGEGQLFVAGSRMIYADDVMNMTSYANQLFITQVLNALCEEQTTISIPAKTMARPPLAITQGETQMLGAVLIGALPVLTLFLGLVMTIKRRHL